MSPSPRSRALISSWLPDGIHGIGVSEGIEVGDGCGVLKGVGVLVGGCIEVVVVEVLDSAGIWVPG